MNLDSDASLRSPLPMRVGLLGLLLAHLAWNLGQPTFLWIQQGDDYSALFGLGFLNGQTLLLALAAAFGPGPIIVRLMAGLILQVALGCATWTRAAGQWNFVEFIYPVFLFWALVALFYLVRHSTGWKIQLPHRFVAANFGLVTLLLLPLAIAGLMPWVRYVYNFGMFSSRMSYFHSPNPGFVLRCLSMFAYFPWLGLILGAPDRLRFAAGAMFSLPVSVTLIIWADGNAGSESPVYFFVPELGLLLTLVLSLLVMHWCGIELVGEPTDAENI